MKDDNVVTEVPQNERQSWIAVMFVWIGSMICLSSLLTGATIISGTNFIIAIIAACLGYGIILIITILQGIESTDLGKPTVVVSEMTYGKRGSRYIFSLIIGIALIGWFRIQTEIAGDTLNILLNDLFNINANVQICSLIVGLLMLLTAIYGFKIMEYLNYVSVPLMIIVLCIAFFNAIMQNDISLLFSYEPEQHMSILQGLGIVVGSFIVGAVIAGDYTRFNKSRKDTMKSAFLGIVPAGILLIIMGAVLTIFSGEDDLTLVLVKYVNSSLLVYIMLLLATWTTNVTNAYSAGLAIINGLQIKDKYRPHATSISGIIGTLLAIFGILDNLEIFLTILTALVTPIAGIMIADYWIKYKGNTQKFINKKLQAKVAISSWIIGCLPALVIMPPFNLILPKIIVNNETINGLSSFIGIFIAMIIYLSFVKKEEVKKEIIWI
ncbi:MAG: cytosine permease [Mycoplasmatales bacterium]